ncbi:glycosyltransferase [Methylobacterium sp. CM6247]
MKIIFVSIGSHGDVLPFIGLAVEMRRRSFNVLLAAPGHFETLAMQARLPFHPLGSQADYDEAIADPNLWHPRKGAALLLEYALKLMPVVDAFLGQEAERGPILVVASTLSLGARIAQDRLGLDVITVHLAPFIFRSRHAPPVIPGVPLPRWFPNGLKHSIQLGAEKYVLNPVSLPAVNAYRAEFNLPAVDRLRTWWHSPQRIILMVPSWFAPPQDDWPHRTVQTGFPRVDTFGDAGTLSPSLAAFLEGGEPPLIFTYGSAMRQAGRFFETAVAICRRMGRRGVLLAPQDGQIPDDLPADVFRAAYAPLSALLPYSAGLIHHGGIGTVAEGLAAGVPQLIVPVAFDHFDEGERLRRLGVGMTLSRRRFTPSRASRCLNMLLHSPTVAEACKEAKERTAQENGIKACCGIIERFAKRRTSPSTA